MLPGCYRYMDSYPQQPHHLGYQTSPQDSSKPKPYYAPTYGPCSEYPTDPTQYHGFYPYCHPAYYPARPPHLPPPPFHGPYPPYGCGYSYCPPPYYAPPLRYPVEQLLDKYVHCCACPNHVCKHKEGERIEDKGHKDYSSPSLEVGDTYPHPLLCFPPDYLKLKANDKASENDPNGWYPFDLVDGKPLTTLQEGDKIWDYNNDKPSQFSFPFFWIPGYDNLKELNNNQVKEVETSPKNIEEQPAKFKVIPVNPSGNIDRGEKPQVMEETQMNNAVNKAKETKAKERNNTVNEAKEIHVKHIEENEKKAAESQSSSLRESAKLPPVCLRVDPLPKKKNGNGKSTSRSPSPPGEKSRATKTTLSVHPTSEIRSCSGPVEQFPSENKAEEKTVRETKVNEAKDEVNHSKEEAVEGTKTPTKVEEKPTLKQLSTTEAALLIQSFYRGHEVRKWEPLKKLKQIAKVREQVSEVRGRVQALESSVELQKEGKYGMLISESIMNLLLQLDTIQGLHPNVREIRKVLAKELVCLQERLDSLATGNAGGEKKHELTNSCEGRVQQASSEMVDSDRCELPETPVNVKDIQIQFGIKELQSAEVAEVSTESATHIESKNDSQDTQCPMSPEGWEGNTEEAEGHGVRDDAVEEPEESSVEMHTGDESGVLQGGDLVAMQDTHEPGSEHAVHDLLQEGGDLCGEHVVQELPVETTDITEPGAESVVEESPQGAAIIHESDAIHYPEELPPGVGDGSQLDAERVQEESQKGASNSNISEPGAKSFQEVQPQWFPDVTDASQVHPMPEQELPQRVPHALEADGVHFPSTDDNKEHSLQVLHGMPQHEIVEFDPTRKEENDIDSVGNVHNVQEEKSLLLPSEVNCQSKELCGLQEDTVLTCDEHIDFKPTSSKDDIAVCRVEGECTIVNANAGSNGGMSGIEIDKPEAAATKINKDEAADSKDLYSESTAKSDPSEEESERSESAPDGNIAREVEMKEEEVITVNNPSRVEAADRKLLEENEKLREMIGKLLHEGKQQLSAISDLNGRVKDLERKLTKKKKLKMRRQISKKQDILCEFGA